MAGFDPYQGPIADPERAPASRPTGLAVTEGMIEALVQTRPWVIFLAVLGFVGAGFMVLAGLFMLIAGVAGIAAGTGTDALPGAVTAGASFLYIAMAAIYVIPCLQMVRYATAIGRIRFEGGPALEDALVRQRSFWRTLGIMTLVLIGLYVLAVVAVAVAAFAGAMSSL